MVVELRQTQDWEQLLDESKSGSVLVFKHSTHCAISDQAYDEFTLFTRQAEDLTCGLVLVIENRGISNAIAAQLGVRHQSPQAIVVRDGRPTWTASHWSITADALNDAMRK